MRVLVTGGLGFVGTNLAIGLLEQPGWGVRVFDNRPSSVAQAPLASDRVEIVTGDIRDAAAIARTARGVDVIVHLAAQTGVVESLDDPRTSVDINVTGLLNVLEAARAGGVRRVVAASSNAAVGRHEPPLSETSVPYTISPYGATKLAGEALATAYFEAYGLETVSLRFSNLYGPWSAHKGSVVASFYRRIRSGAPIVVHGDGQQTRDFLYTGDLTRALVATVREALPSRVYQVASGQETSIRRLAELCAETAAAGGGPRVEVQYDEPRAGDVPRNFSDVRRIARELGFSPAVSLEDGLQRTWSWFQTTGAGADS
jgi:UDP-glucose 4-epimerase